MPSEATVDRNAVWVAPSKPDLEIEVTTLEPSTPCAQLAVAFDEAIPSLRKK